MEKYVCYVAYNNLMIMNNIWPIPFYSMFIGPVDNDQANDKDFANVSHLLKD